MGRNYAVLREPRAIAVVVEPLFVSHPADEELALRPDHADRMAGALLAGLSDYLRRAGDGRRGCADEPRQPVRFTVTQRQRLRELGARRRPRRRSPTPPPATGAFKELERRLTAEGRRHLQELRAAAARRPCARSPMRLRAALTGAGFVEVVTPHIISADALRKMGIPPDDPLAEQIFWLDCSHCLRPMLAPNLYTAHAPAWRASGAGRSASSRWAPAFGATRRAAGTSTSSPCSTLVEVGLPLEERRPRLEELAGAGARRRPASTATSWQTVGPASTATPSTCSSDGVEVCSTAMGPHPLDDAWGITETWVGLGFGLERLLRGARRAPEHRARRAQPQLPGRRAAAPLA